MVPRGGIEPPTPAFSVPHALFLHDPALAPQSRKLLSRLKSARPHFPRKPSVAHGLGTMTVPLLIFQKYPPNASLAASEAGRTRALRHFHMDDPGKQRIRADLLRPHERHFCLDAVV